MTAPTPPFRADHRGSLLRPKRVRQARKSFFEDGTITRAELSDCEDVQILRLLHRQEQLGLKAASDGAARLTHPQYDFLGGLEGVDLVARGTGRGRVPVISTRPAFPEDHPMLAHFAYLRDHTNVRAKGIIPAPSSLVMLAEGADDLEPEALLADTIATWRAAIAAFHGAGCRYLQLDDVFFARLCAPERGAVGEAPEPLIARHAGLIREVLSGRPEDMVIALNLCQGDMGPEGRDAAVHDAAIDALFNETGVDVFFMDFTGEGADSLAVLRHLSPGHQRVMAGFIDARNAEPEGLDALKRRFDAAAKFTDPDQLGIAPNRGFSAFDAGEEITEDAQWRKLELLVTCAETIWGEV